MALRFKCEEEHELQLHVTGTTTFTRTHARHIAAKVATDLKRMQRFYGEPPDNWIDAFEAEAIEFLKGGILDTVAYGFRRNGDWIEPTLIYTSRDLMVIAANDDDPGRVRPSAQIWRSVLPTAT